MIRRTYNIDDDGAQVMVIYGDVLPEGGTLTTKLEVGWRSAPWEIWSPPLEPVKQDQTDDWWDLLVAVPDSKMKVRARVEFDDGEFDRLIVTTQIGKAGAVEVECVEAQDDPGGAPPLAVYRRTGDVAT